MPKVGQYRANSVIYFQGDMGDKIFVLQKGYVSLNYNDIETGKEIREVIQMGEFFGVKSALGRYPREENAVVLKDTQVLIFTVPEYEEFAEKNIRIILKTLKVFSNQLRRVHRQVENLMENTQSVNPETGLFNTGEYYLRNRMYSQAKYVMSRYLTYYPAGKMAEAAAQYLDAAENSLVRYGDGKGPVPISSTPSGMRVFSSSDDTAESHVSSQSPRVKADSGNEETQKDYYNALSLFSQGKYQEALKGFKAIIDADDDEEYTDKAQFDLGRCLFALSQWDLSIQHFTKIIHANPRHQDMTDMLYIMGQAWEKKGDQDKAKGFYKKVLSMSGDEDTSARVKARKALNILGGA